MTLCWSHGQYVGVILSPSTEYQGEHLLSSSLAPCARCLLCSLQGHYVAVPGTLLVWSRQLIRRRRSVLFNAACIRGSLAAAQVNGDAGSLRPSWCLYREAAPATRGHSGPLCPTRSSPVALCGTIAGIRATLANAVGSRFCQAAGVFGSCSRRPDLSGASSAPLHRLPPSETGLALCCVP